MPSGRFKGIRLAKFERMLKESGLTIQDVIENEQSIVGRLEGVDAIIMGLAVVGRGRVAYSPGLIGMLYGRDLDYITSCNIRMVDLSSGKLILTATYDDPKSPKRKGETSHLEMGELLAKEISKLSWE